MLGIFRDELAQQSLDGCKNWSTQQNVWLVPGNKI